MNKKFLYIYIIQSIFCIVLIMCGSFSPTLGFYSRTILIGIGLYVFWGLHNRLLNDNQ